MIGAALVAALLAPDTVLTLGDTPTVIAFVGAERAEVMYSGDWAQVVHAFQPALDAARPEIEALGAVVHEAYAPAVVLHSRGREWSIEPAPAQLLTGYYLWAPEGPRYLCRGAMKKDDLVGTVTTFLARARDHAEADLPGCERAP